MIRAYSVMEKEFFLTDVVSQNELDDLIGKVEWLWVDCSDLDDEETMIIQGLLGIETKILSEIEKGRIHPSYEKCRDYTWISTPFVDLKNELELHPMSIFVKESLLVTLRNERSSEFIGSAIKTLKDFVEEGKKVKLCFIVSRLLHEMAVQNSKSMVSFRELLDRIEEEALEKPRSKAVTHSVFKLKRLVSSLHRLLWVEKELISDIREGVIPHVKLTREAKMIVDDAMDDINRELEFVDSYYRSLDSILTLQDLSLIHGVERTLLYLTVIILVMNALLIILSQ